MTEFFLGIDGGQSHTTALIADAGGRICGCGRGGESNHTRAPGGRERLETAILKSVGEAMQNAGLIAHGLPPDEKRKALRGFRFASAHLAMTGEPEDKVAIVRQLLRAKKLVVGHDAPGALAGALPDKEAGVARIIVLAGTGSVAIGEKGYKQSRIGGRGYLFSDEGSAFAIARETLARALRAEDCAGKPDQLHLSLLEFFERDSLKAIAEDFYAGLITRERLASFTSQVNRLARDGNETAIAILWKAALQLAEMVQMAAGCLNGRSADRQLARISYGGGVFKSRILFAEFSRSLKTALPQAEILKPRFGPDIGALLLAYRQGGINLTETLLKHVAGTH